MISVFFSISEKCKKLIISQKDKWDSQKQTSDAKTPTEAKPLPQPQPHRNKSKGLVLNDSKNPDNFQPVTGPLKGSHFFSGAFSTYRGFTGNALATSLSHPAGKVLSVPIKWAMTTASTCSFLSQSVFDRYSIRLTHCYSLDPKWQLLLRTPAPVIRSPRMT